MSGKDSKKDKERDKEGSSKSRSSSSKSTRSSTKDNLLLAAKMLEMPPSTHGFKTMLNVCSGITPMSASARSEAVGDAVAKAPVTTATRASGATQDNSVDRVLLAMKT